MDLSWNADQIVFVAVHEEGNGVAAAARQQRVRDQHAVRLGAPLVVGSAGHECSGVDDGPTVPAGPGGASTFRHPSSPVSCVSPLATGLICNPSAPLSPSMRKVYIPKSVFSNASRRFLVWIVLVVSGIVEKPNCAQAHILQ